jgi:hypothetical protein
MADVPLTPKQEAFCLAYLEAGNASEAYRHAYDAACMAPATVHRKAKALLDNGKIAARLSALRAPAAEQAQVTLAGHLEALARLRDDAWRAGRYGSAIQAEIARGKAGGVHVERHEHRGTGAAVSVYLPENMREAFPPQMVAALLERLGRGMHACTDEELLAIATSGQQDQSNGPEAAA